MVCHLSACWLLVFNAWAWSLEVSSYDVRQYDQAPSIQVNPNSPTHSQDFHMFQTRPDIQAPKWNVTVSDGDALAAGYWFVSTYESVPQNGDENKPWIGPHIYDQTGELVWSGVSAFAGYNVKDFKVSNVEGVPMLTGIYVVKGVEVILTNRYELFKAVPIENSSAINIHHFDIVDNGTRSLAMTTRNVWAFDEEAEAFGCRWCEVIHPGFEERDVKTWGLTFEWNAHGHIYPNESFVPPECEDLCDSLHANSIDKFPDGDYLLSARHSDTLYKISRIDGSIVWRLGGAHSDWDLSRSGLHFSGQHDARVRLQNETCTIISILDNAIRPGEHGTTNDQSRGMVIVLRDADKTAEAIRIYDHPHGNYAVGRGNFQILENGNAFLGWYMQSLISEYSPEGKLLSQANWKPTLRSYRSYKYDWIGRPVAPPDVYAVAVHIEGEGVTHTNVCVSWNGATEVDSWLLYSTTEDGQAKEKLTSTKRQGFETMLTYSGLVRYVLVEAIDRKGDYLGQSNVFKTMELKDSEVIQDGFRDCESQNRGLSKLMRSTTLGGSIIGSVSLVVFVRLARVLRKRAAVTRWRYCLRYS